MRLSEGLARDFGVRPDLRLLEPERPEAIAEIRAQLEELLARDLGARRLATRVTNEQLRVRRLFLARRYHLLVDEHRADRASDLPDATLVLLVLSADQIEATALRDRWSIELRRRYPDPELAAWLSDLGGTAS